ncbi:MAG: T9SS type B sorting domain-containing protein [Sphingobacteriia bacterium]
MRQLFTILLLILLLFSNDVLAQKCATNLDFENADLLFWNCDTGRSSVNGNTYFPVSDIPNRHTVIRNNPLNLDPYGKFPINCPNGSGYSLQLGNNGTGAQTERVSYTFTIPANLSIYSMVYWYAVVFQNPGHAPQEQPKFNVNVTDLTTGEVITCASFEYVVSKNLPGFQTSTVQANVEYKPWTPVTVNLSNRNGHSMKIDFSTSDCTRGGHFGYAYIDIDSDCGFPLKGAGYCNDVDSVELVAPYGYKAYQWYTNNFKDLVSNEYRVVLRPPPTLGTKFSVILTPYDGYGCTDTLNSVVKTGFIPPFNLSDKTVCEGDSTVLDVGISNPGLSFNWLPVIGIRSPDASKTVVVPKETILYKLKVIDTASGCTKEKEINIEVIKQNPAVVIKGDTVSCGTKPYNTELNIASGAFIQWFFNGSPIAGENGTSILPRVTGLYKATLQKAGCLVSSRNIRLRNSPAPVASFTINNEAQCLTGNNFLVNAGNALVYPIRREWNWGDGRIDTDSVRSYSYPQVGVYRLTLKFTSVDNCIDSVSKTINVYAPPKPNFDVENACENTNTKFTNTTPAIPGSVIDFTWNFGNATPSFNAINAVNSFNKSGPYFISLKAVTAECPVPIEIQKRITILASPPGRRKIINTALEVPTTLETINKGTSYKWFPTNNLDDALISNPLFSGPASAKYLVEIINQTGCIIVDTVEVKLFDKISILLPTAFTPNGDGKNDRLSPILIGIDKLEYFRIWNRWGVLIFETKTPKPGWDGTFNGVNQETGSYVWEAAGLGIGGALVKKQGLFTLLR